MANWVFHAIKCQERIGVLTAIIGHNYQENREVILLIMDIAYYRKTHVIHSNGETTAVS